jgi:Flp pilus assembly protein TadD
MNLGELNCFNTVKNNFGMKAYFVSIAIVSAMVLSATFCSVCLAKAKDNPQLGRAGNWKSNAQGSPSVEACRKGVAQRPDDPEAQNDLGWALRQHGELKEAEEHLRQALKLNSKLAFAHSNLSVVLLDGGKKEEALSEAKQSVELDPKQAIYHVVLGNAFSAAGDQKSAIKEYQAALTLRPDYENALYNLGRALSADGQRTEAKTSLSQALQLDPNDERVLKLLDEITR